MALIFVAIAFTVLSFFEPFKGWGAIVGSIIGALDFCFGLGFQLYEMHDDMKQKANTQKAQESLQKSKEKTQEKEKSIDNSVVQNAKDITNYNQIVHTEPGSHVEQIEQIMNINCTTGDKHYGE